MVHQTRKQTMKQNINIQKDWDKNMVALTTLVAHLPWKSYVQCQPASPWCVKV